MATPNSLRQLQYLVALADKLNFTRAAEACFVTQSTLSAGLRELEAVLGTRLVERTRQTVLMTRIGLEVATRARVILAATQDLADVAAEARPPMAGLLRLGVIPTVAPFVLPPTLESLRERYSKLRLALREDLTANLLARIEEGQLDMALIALPFDTGNLRVEPLFEDELWVVGRSDDSLFKANSVSVTPSLTDRLLLLEEGHCLRDHALYACGASARHSPEPVEATSLLTLVQMVSFGLGVALVPEMALKSGLTENTNLIARRMAKPRPKRTIALVTRRSTTRLGDLKALAEILLRVRRRLEKSGSGR
jgi:LysR family hydrogen peroxide-inducible transcriptional activator